MGIALILLGLVAAGLVVDFAVENWSAAADDVTFSLFGSSFTATQVEVAIGAAVLGAIAIALCVLGAGLVGAAAEGGPRGAGCPSSNARTPRSATGIPTRTSASTTASPSSPSADLASNHCTPATHPGASA